MAQYRLTATVDDARIDIVQKKLKEVFPNGQVQVEKVHHNRSRADRLSDAEAKFEDAKSEVESLKDEVSEWYENMPENFQQGDKGSEVQECADALEELQNNLENCDFSNVSFPAAF